MATYEGIVCKLHGLVAIIGTKVVASAAVIEAFKTTLGDGDAACLGVV